MRATEFQLEVLGRVADDYEAVSTIRGDIERDLGRTVSEEEVASALLALAGLGLVDAFVYDGGHSKYQRVAVDTHAASELWFFISQVGRLKYDSSEV